MFELIVLGVILAGLTAIARAPVPRQSAQNTIRPVLSPWSIQTDWQRFDKPTYLRRGVVLDDGAASSGVVRGRRCPAGAGRPSTGEAPRGTSSSRRWPSS
jgi:hypothetical protein